MNIDTPRIAHQSRARSITPATRRSPRLAAAFAALAMVSACGDPRDAFNRDPQVSDISVSNGTIPEASFVQVPMPPPEAPAGPVVDAP